jgi:type I restriction enzyme M protein
MNLSAKQRKALLDAKNWKKQHELMNIATELMEAIGTAEFNDFNVFSQEVDSELKARRYKLSTSEKKTILDAVSWYDAEAEKVIKRIHKLKGDKLEQLLAHLDCEESQLADFGYYASGTAGEYIEYESETDLKDTENIPLKENIYDFFIREVKPHVEEAWINLDSTKIGYEISFNKYFYRHQPLRSLEEVSRDILQLEEESEGLIRDILNFA